MNLPVFRKGEVLRAADLQELSDAVAGLQRASRDVPAERGGVWPWEVRTPIRRSGDARLAVCYDNPGESMGCDMYGRVLAVGYGLHQGPGTEAQQMLDCQACIVSCTPPGWRGSLWQTVMVKNNGMAESITKVFRLFYPPGRCLEDWNPKCVPCVRPLPSLWWGDDGQKDSGGDLRGMGKLSWLVGCMRCNPCTYACGEPPLRLGSQFRRQEELPVPHLVFNAPGGCEAGHALVLRQSGEENVSRLRGLRAGDGVRIECCTEFLRIHAAGGGLRPINPPGCEPAGGCSPAGGCCVQQKPVQLVGCEYPAGAPTGVIIRQLVGRAGAKVRLSCCRSCTGEVLSKVPVNVCECGGCAAGGLRLVLPECCGTCCTVPVRRLEPAGGLRGDVTPRSARLWVDLDIRNCTQGRWGAAAEPHLCGWIRSLFVPGSGGSCAPDCNGCGPDLPPQPCGEGALRQLMRYWSACGACSELQVVQQVKRDGVWVRFVGEEWPPPGVV